VFGALTIGGVIKYTCFGIFWLMLSFSITGWVIRDVLRSKLDYEDSWFVVLVTILIFLGILFGVPALFYLIGEYVYPSIVKFLSIEIMEIINYFGEIRLK